MRFLVAEKLGPHKFKTPEGYLICTDAILSRTGKQEYKRCEIFGDACDEPDEIVNVDRVDTEVFSDKAMASFENKPICIEHPDQDVNIENHNELAVGFVRDVHKGEDNGHPVMMGTLVITDKDAVEAVESGEYKELSCGYDCDIDDDDNPQQRNIRGNHVALCKHGRAGIARIVDSIKDSEYHQIDMTDPWGGTRSLIVKAFSFEEAKKKAEKFKPEWKFRAGYQASKDDVDWAERRGLYVDSKIDDAPDLSGLYKNDDNDAIKVTRNGFSYEVRFGEDSIFNRGWSYSRSYDGTHLSQYLRQNKFKKVSKFDYLKDSVKSIRQRGDNMDFSKKTKQGYDVLEMYRDGGRLHAIFKRANDYGVALGYDTTDGQWAQGMYDYSTLNEAREALKETKPYARRIQDSVKDNNSDLPEEEDAEFLFRSAYGDEIFITNWDGKNQFMVVYEGREQLMNRRDVEQYLDRKGAKFSRVLKDSTKFNDDAWSKAEEENYKKANEAVIDEEYVQLPRGRFNVVKKTKEELEKEGYHYHHSDNGYSVYVKNNSAVAIKDSIIDAKTEYVFNWRDTYHGAKDKTRVDANSIKEAIKKFGNMIALGGIGTANCYVISISPNDGYVRTYGKLSDLLRTFKDCDMKDAVDENEIRNLLNKAGYSPLKWYRGGAGIEFEIRKGAFGNTNAVKLLKKYGYDAETTGLTGVVVYDSMKNDNKEQLFTVKYKQGDTTYIRKVRANSIEDAISKVKDVYNKFEHETDKEYLKSSINEMSRYISNWSFMTTREKRNISPEGLGALKQMLKFAQQRLAELK